LGTEARFAYQLALREWSGNDAARRRLHGLISRLAAHEIARGNTDGARALIGELDAPDVALNEDFDELLEREEQERRRVHDLQCMTADADIGKQAVSRTRQLRLTGALVFVVVSVITLRRFAGLFVFRRDGEPHRGELRHESSLRWNGCGLWLAR
jgi:hypothetical protein